MLVRGVFFDLYGTLLVPKNSKKAWKFANNAGIKPILIQHQSSKRILTENDYYSNSVAKSLNTENTMTNPWKVISNLRDLYKVLNL